MISSQTIPCFLGTFVESKQEVDILPSKSTPFTLKEDKLLMAKQFNKQMKMNESMFRGTLLESKQLPPSGESEIKTDKGELEIFHDEMMDNLDINLRKTLGRNDTLMDSFNVKHAELPKTTIRTFFCFLSPSLVSHKIKVN